MANQSVAFDTKVVADITRIGDIHVDGNTLVVGDSPIIIEAVRKWSGQGLDANNKTRQFGVVHITIAVGTMLDEATSPSMGLLLEPSETPQIK